MRARRVWAAVCAAGLAVGLATAGSSPAAAATSATLDCQTSTGLELVLAAGETLTLDLTNCYSVVAVEGAVTTPAEIDYECASGSPGTVPSTSYGCLFSNSGPGITRWSVTVAAPLVIGPVASFYRWDDSTAIVVRSVAGHGGQDATIPAWVQAYGRASADAACLDGWNPSWDQWPNGGTGGFVCQRSIPSVG